MVGWCDGRADGWRRPMTLRCNGAPRWPSEASPAPAACAVTFVPRGRQAQASSTKSAGADSAKSPRDRDHARTSQLSPGPRSSAPAIAPHSPNPLKNGSSSPPGAQRPNAPLPPTHTLPLATLPLLALPIDCLVILCMVAVRVRQQVGAQLVQRAVPAARRGQRRACAGVRAPPRQRTALPCAALPQGAQRRVLRAMPAAPAAAQPPAPQAVAASPAAQHHHQHSITSTSTSTTPTCGRWCS